MYISLAKMKPEPLKVPLLKKVESKDIVKEAREGRFRWDIDVNKTKGNTNTEKGFDRGLDFCIKLAKKWFEDVTDVKESKNGKQRI